LPLPEEDPRWQEIGAKLSDDHLAKLVERQLNRLERSVIDAVYRRRGTRPYDPILLLKMVVYQYLKGQQSPAAWCEEAQLNQAMQWLGRGYTPSRRAWYDFRDRAAQFIAEVHEQIIHRALAEGLLDPTVGVQDGTAIAACASRHRVVNRSTLAKRRTQLDSVLSGAVLGGERDEEMPPWVPTTTRGQQDLAKRLQQADEVLTKRLEKNSQRPSDKRQAPDKIRVSLSDPPAPLGRDKLKVYRPLYTVQYMVAPRSLLILSYGCEPAATDAGTLAPMIDKTQAVVGGRLLTVLADAAYCSIVDLQQCEQRHVELLAPVQANAFTAAKHQAQPHPQISREQFVWDAAENCCHCPQGQRLAYVDRTRKRRHSDQTLWEYRYRADPALCQACPLAARCLRPGAACRTIRRLEGQELLDIQRQKMADPAVQARYRLRGETVELTYAECKGNRHLTRFHGRGPERAQTETGLMVVAQNLLRLDRLERNRASPTKTNT
jgi:transposase